MKQGSLDSFFQKKPQNEKESNEESKIKLKEETNKENKTENNIKNQLSKEDSTSKESKSSIKEKEQKEEEKEKKEKEKIKKNINKNKRVIEDEDLEEEILENEKEKPPEENKNNTKTNNNNKDDNNKNINSKNEIPKKSNSQNSTEQDSILFNDIVEVLSKIETTTGQNSKDIIKDLFSNLFIKIIEKFPEDLPRIYYFLTSKIGPEYRTPEFGIGNNFLEKMVGKVVGINDTKIKELLKETGDLGEVACKQKEKVKTMDVFSGFIKVKETKKITLKNVIDNFKQLSYVKGNKSVTEKENILSKIIYNCNKNELKCYSYPISLSLSIYLTEV